MAEEQKITLPSISCIATSPLIAKASSSTSFLPGPVVQVPLPDQKQTISEKLEASLEALKTSYQASAPVYGSSSMPQYASNLEEIAKFVRVAIDSEGGYGGKEGECASIYVCGGPGVGT
jgi:hypothetical protein